MLDKGEKLEFGVGRLVGSREMLPKRSGQIWAHRESGVDVTQVDRLRKSALLLGPIAVAIDWKSTPTLVPEAVQKVSLSFRPQGEILFFVQISQSLRSFEMTNMAYKTASTSDFSTSLFSRPFQRMAAKRST